LYIYIYGNLKKTRNILLKKCLLTMARTCGYVVGSRDIIVMDYNYSSTKYWMKENTKKPSNVLIWHKITWIYISYKWTDNICIIISKKTVHLTLTIFACIRNQFAHTSTCIVYGDRSFTNMAKTIMRKD